MKGFRALVVLGVLLVTLLVVIDYIDAAQKGSKLLKDNEKSNLKQKSQKLYSSKSEKNKKVNTNKASSFGEDIKKVKENSKVETKQFKVKRGTTYTSKDSHTVEGSKPKITKTYQKVKKYKVVEDEPSQKFTSSGTNKAKNVKSSHKKTYKEKDNIQEVIDELSRMYHEDAGILEEENVLNNQKKKKYRLVDVTLQEEEEEAEEADEVKETLIEEDPEEEELSSTRTESAEVIGKFKSTTVKLPKSKKSSKKITEPVEEEILEDPTNEEAFHNNTEDNAEMKSQDDSNPHTTTHSSRYEDPNPQSGCRRLPEDPNRQGPKKLTHYVIEEEVDGKIRRRVISEEDGVTMCEVADLLKAQYNEYLNENPIE